MRAALAAILLLSLTAHADDVIRFDFETADLQGFEVTEGQFDKLLNDRTMCRNDPTESPNKHGVYNLSTVELANGGANDGMTGTLESPVFTFLGAKVTFRIGGGSHPDTYVALCTADGKEVLKASGHDTEVMSPVEWDAAALVGQKVFVRIVDHNTGPWGHVTFDDFTAPGRLDTPPLPPDAVRFDFETGDLQGCELMEGKFDLLLCSRDMCRNDPKIRHNHQGKTYLSTVELQGGGFDDGLTGVLESPVFRLTGPQCSFLVGGGGHPDTFVALCAEDGAELLAARGRFGELMQRIEWDLSPYVGRKVFLQIVDHNTGSWGHITLDDFTARGELDADATAAVRRTFAARMAAAGQREAAAQALRDTRWKQHRQDLMSPAYLTARGQTRVYEGDNLTAIQFLTGGIGAGSIRIDGQAVRRVWSLFNNADQAFVPHSFFAVRAQAGAAPAVVRALQTAPVWPFQPMAKLTFRGEHPFAWYDFVDPELPVKVELEVFTPLIPGNLRDSAMPCAIYRLTAENRGNAPVQASFLAAQQNAVGYTGNGAIRERSWQGYGGNRNRVLREAGATILSMTSDKPKEAPGNGDLALAALTDGAAGTAGWADLDKLAQGFTQSGTLAGDAEAGPSAPRQTLDGALAVPFRLAPGEKRSVTFVLTWSFPNTVHGQGPWGGQGNRYVTWWPDALGLARDLRDRLPELERATRLYHDTLYASNLPVWLLDRVSSQVAILSSPTCFFTADGFFGAWEGCNADSGCCAGNCTHVWHYAQAHARLWPELGRTMREEELKLVTVDGAAPHRLFPGTPPAFDGQCGTVLGTYREYLTSADRTWLDQWWPKAKLAADFLIARWDLDEDGVLKGPQWNTLDAELGGSSTWMGSLYLAALAAAEQMATVEGQPDAAARYHRIRESGSRQQDATLFNGEYFIQLPDAKAYKDFRTGCIIDQVLGQWWANQLDLGWLYPPEHVRSALGALAKHNFRLDFRDVHQAPRKFVDDDDAGTQMLSWPREGRPEGDATTLYADEVMTGFEYAAAAAMVQAGMLEDGLRLSRAIADRYDGRMRTRVTGVWGNSGNPFGDDECGKWYGRAMSSWSLLLAAQGFVYDGPAGVIGFRPVWRPEDHASFFTAAEGWGLYRQKRDGRNQTATLALRHGRLAVEKLVFALPDGAKAGKVEVRLGGKAVTARVEGGAERVTVTLAERAVLQAGGELTVVLRW